MTKDEIRKEILALRADMDKEEAMLASQIICRKLMQTKEYEEAEDICLYSPIRNEVDILMLAEIAMEDGKKVWLPKTKGEIIDFHLYEGEDKMEKGPFNVMEPVSEDILTPTDKTLIVMPGAVFTQFRDRIGYGGGYYDKYLDANPMCKTIAVCYDLQVVEEIPTEAHDRRPDYVICETAIFG